VELSGDCICLTISAGFLKMHDFVRQKHRVATAYFLGKGNSMSLILLFEYGRMMKSHVKGVLIDSEPGNSGLLYTNYSGVRTRASDATYK
jgi:hypothetical protein